MRLCFDLDGSICENKTGTMTYSDVKPLPGAVETLKKLKADGHYIIIQTARHMRTYQANHGKILANLQYLYDWLNKWEISYDELLIGKPDVDLFVDDKGYHHEDWKTTEQYLHDLIQRKKLL